MVEKTNSNKATADGPNSTQNQNPNETHFCNNIGIVVWDSCSWLVCFKEWDFGVHFLLLIQKLKKVWMFLAQCLEKHQAISGDWILYIQSTEGNSSGVSQWLGFIKAACSVRPWTRRASHPCAWCSLRSSHGPAVCVCDRAITAQHGLRDLTPHHRPGHLLFNLTQCAGKYSRNGQSNDRSWGSLPQKQLWVVFAIMILPESATKMLITVDANPHNFGHLCLCQTGMLTFTYYASNADN